MFTARLSEGLSEKRATWAGQAEMLWRMDSVSIRQVAMRNSGRRRKALVSKRACMRLESATRTHRAAFTVADGVELIPGLPTEVHNAAIVGMCKRHPQGHARVYFVRPAESGMQPSVLWIRRPGCCACARTRLPGNQERSEIGWRGLRRGA